MFHGHNRWVLSDSDQQYWWAYSEDNSGHNIDKGMPRNNYPRVKNPSWSLRNMWSIETLKKNAIVLRTVEDDKENMTNYNSMAFTNQRFNAACTRAFQLSLSWAESIQFLFRSILICFSHPRKSIPVNILKAVTAVQPSSILNILRVHLNVLDLTTLAILNERYKFSLSTPHSHHYWAQIFAAGSCF